MRFKLLLEEDYLRAEIEGRETAQETDEFLKEVAREALKHEQPRLLIVVRSSRPIFKVEEFRISKHFEAMGQRSGYRVALLSDSSESYAAQSYIEALAQYRGLKVHAFRDEAAALAWLRRDD